MRMQFIFVNGFDEESAKMIADALSFVKLQIERYEQEKKDLLVDVTHFDVIESEIGTILGKIRVFGDVVKRNVDVMFNIEDSHYNELIDFVRSALEEYLVDTLRAKEVTGMSSFDSKIAEIRRLISLESLKDGKKDLFSKYFKSSVSIEEGNKVEVFLSYSHIDRILAGKVAKLLEEKGIDVFLAHEDVDVSDEWRDEIFRHLKSCTLLIALLTPDFAESVWTNQECGYVLAKGARIISLIVGEADIKVFGFLESLQGIHLKEDNLPDCVERILKIIIH